MTPERLQEFLFWLNEVNDPNLIGLLREVIGVGILATFGIFAMVFFVKIRSKL